MDLDSDIITTTNFSPVALLCLAPLDGIHIIWGGEQNIIVLVALYFSGFFVFNINNILWNVRTKIVHDVDSA